MTEAAPVVELTNRFIVYVEQDDEGHWFALTKASPYFCLQGGSPTEVLSAAGRRIDSCLKRGDAPPHPPPERDDA